MGKEAYSPSGSPIVSTIETCYGEADIAMGSWSRRENGTLDFDYGGSTNFWWDTQRSVTYRKERLFMDSNGEIWPESKLRLFEEGEGVPVFTGLSEDIELDECGALVKRIARLQMPSGSFDTDTALMQIITEARQIIDQGD